MVGVACFDFDFLFIFFSDISKIEMISQCILFFIAGYETTASALTLTIHNMMVHPEIQERVYEEIEKVLQELAKEHNEADLPESLLELVNLDNLSQFKLLGAVLDETLRLYAPANFLERTCTNDVTIESSDGKTKIDFKKGDLVHMPVYVVHRDERYFPEPSKFDPERFLGEREKEHHRYSYIPFGAGPRNCVARTFALLEAKLALLHCIYNYRFAVSSKTSIPPNLLIQGGFVSPKNCFATIEKRRH